MFSGSLVYISLVPKLQRRTTHPLPRSCLVHCRIPHFTVLQPELELAHEFLILLNTIHEFGKSVRAHDTFHLAHGHSHSQSTLDPIALSFQFQTLLRPRPFLERLFQGLDKASDVGGVSGTQGNANLMSMQLNVFGISQCSSPNRHKGGNVQTAGEGFETGGKDAQSGLAMRNDIVHLVLKGTQVHVALYFQARYLKEGRNNGILHEIHHNLWHCLSWMWMWVTAPILLVVQVCADTHKYPDDALRFSHQTRVI